MLASRVLVARFLAYACAPKHFHDKCIIYGTVLFTLSLKLTPFSFPFNIHAVSVTRSKKRAAFTPA